MGKNGCLKGKNPSLPKLLVVEVGGGKKMLLLMHESGEKYHNGQGDGTPVCNVYTCTTTET